jgi:hypothetical protein
LRQSTRFSGHFDPARIRCKRAVKAAPADFGHHRPHTFPGPCCGVALRGGLRQPGGRARAICLLGIGLLNSGGAAVSCPCFPAGAPAEKRYVRQLSPCGACVRRAGGFCSAISAILPYALAFAAGAMIFVVAQDLIPRSQYGASSIAPRRTLWAFPL